MQKYKNSKEKNGFAVPGVFLTSAAVILIFSGIFVYQYLQIQKVRDGAYRSQEDCEQKTGQKCGYGMCDVIPPGKTVEEVCGKNFHQGWMPFNQTPKKNTNFNFKFIEPVPPSDSTLPAAYLVKPTRPADYLKAEVIFVTVADLVSSSKIFLNKKVHVRGYLINTKESYFPSPEFAITDRVNGQTRFKVTAWHPLEVPPLPPGSTLEQPHTMQNYLGRIVELTGFVRKTGSFFNPSFYLEVLSGEYGLVD